MYVDIAVCLPLSRTFVYRVDEPVEAGCRVVVPFRKREVEGFVVAPQESAPTVNVLRIKEVIDSEPLLRPDIFKLCRWISEYYVSPLGEVLKGALPPGITPKHVGNGATGDGRKGTAPSRDNDSTGIDDSRSHRGAAPFFPSPVAPFPTLTSDQSRA